MRVGDWCAEILMRIYALFSLYLLLPATIEYSRVTWPFHVGVSAVSLLVVVAADGGIWCDMYFGYFS